MLKLFSQEKSVVSRKNVNHLNFIILKNHRPLLRNGILNHSSRKSMQKENEIM